MIDYLCSCSISVQPQTIWWKVSELGMTMTADSKRKNILVLCDYDALYTAIELKLGSLPGVQVSRLDSIPTEHVKGQAPPGNFDLMIVATVSPTCDPMSLPFTESLLDQIGETPVLVISEQPSRPAPDGMITYLNFPYDMDELTQTVSMILDKHPPSGN